MGKATFFAAALLVTFPFAALPWLPGVASAIRIQSLRLNQPNISRVSTNYGEVELGLTQLLAFNEDGSLFQPYDYNYSGTVDNLGKLVGLDDVQVVDFHNIRRNESLPVPSQEETGRLFSPKAINWLKTRNGPRFTLRNLDFPRESVAREDFDSLLMQLTGIANSSVSVWTDLHHSTECIEQLQTAAHFTLLVDLRAISYQSPEWDRSIKAAKAVAPLVMHLRTKHLDAELAAALQQSKLTSFHCVTVDGDALASVSTVMTNGVSMQIVAPDMDQVRKGLSRWSGDTLNLMLATDASNADLLSALPPSITHLRLDANLTDQDLENFVPSPNWQTITLRGVEFTKPAVVEFLKRLNAQAARRDVAIGFMPSIQIIASNTREGKRNLTKDDIEEILEWFWSSQPTFDLTIR